MLLHLRRSHYKKFVRFEVFTAVTMKNAVFRDVASCSSCVNRGVGGTYRLNFQFGCSHLLTLAPRSRIFLPWRWRRHVHPKRRFTHDLHGATSHKMEFFKVSLFENIILYPFLCNFPHAASMFYVVLFSLVNIGVVLYLLFVCATFVCMFPLVECMSLSWQKGNNFSVTGENTIALKYFDLRSSAVWRSRKGNSCMRMVT
jgi:hypothetical protein